MVMGRLEGVPIPDPKLWAGVAAYSFLVASSGDIASFLLQPKETYYVAIPSVSIKDIARRIENYFKDQKKLLDYRGWALLNNDIISRKEKSLPRIVKILNNLCIKKDLNDVTIIDLARGVANSLRGTCTSAMNPVELLSILRAEFYKFTRFFMPYPSSEKYEARRYFRGGLPALVQAFGLLGHIASIIVYYSENNTKITHNLVALPRPGSREQTKDATKLYRTAKVLLERGWREWRNRVGALPWQVTNLIIAGVMIQEKMISSIPVDLLVESSLSYGRRITLTMLEPISASALYYVLNNSYKDCTNIVTEGRIEFVQKIASTGKRVEVAHPLLATILGAVFIKMKKGRGEGGFDPNRVNARLLIEYGNYLYNYASSYAAGRPQRDYAFNAARTAGQAMQTLAKYGAWWWSVLACVAAKAAKLEPKLLLPI